MIVIITGATASGKDTICEQIKGRGIADIPISYTTRPMRASEIEGREYHFIDDYEFQNMLINDKFIEIRGYKVEDGSVWHYGLAKSSIGDIMKNNYIVILDYEGTRMLMSYLLKQYPLSLIKTIYIDCDVNIRIKRYLSRSKNKEDAYEMCRRILSDKKRIEDFKSEYEYVLQNNTWSDLEDNIGLIEKIFKKG